MTSRKRSPGLRARFDHPVRAYRHYSEREGSTLAAAVTYFAFLSLFPLLALSFAAVGFVADYFPALNASWMRYCRVCCRA